MHLLRELSINQSGYLFANMKSLYLHLRGYQHDGFLS